MPSYRFPIPSIERNVVGILRRTRDRHIVQRLVPGVVRLEVKAALETPRHLHLELMGCRTAIGIQSGNRSPGLIRTARLNRSQGLRHRQIALVGVPRDTRPLIADVGYP